MRSSSNVVRSVQSDSVKKLQSQLYAVLPAGYNVATQLKLATTQSCNFETTEEHDETDFRRTGDAETGDWIRSMCARAHVIL